MPAAHGSSTDAHRGACTELGFIPPKGSWEVFFAAPPGSLPFGSQLREVEHVHGDSVTTYNDFARHYDTVIGDRAPVGRYLMALIGKTAPRARTVLELGCGSGTMLEFLTKRYRVTGVDNSRAMLAIARRKAPRARLVCADIRALKLSEQFDVVVCPFDTMNHLATRRDWAAAFRTAREHLKPGGIFIFDVNTHHKLERYRSEPVELREHAKGFSSVSVQKARGAHYDVTLSIFVAEGGGLFRRHCMTIRERVPSASEIVSQASSHFSRVGIIDPDRGAPAEDSEELFFVCTAHRSGAQKRG